MVIWTVGVLFGHIEVYEEPVPRRKKIPHCAFELETGEENTIVNESF